MDREEGGRILPFKNEIMVEGTVKNWRSEGRDLIYKTEHIMLQEIIRGIEHLSQQIYEASGRANLGTCCGVIIENNFKYCPVCGVPIPPAA